MRCIRGSIRAPGMFSALALAAGLTPMAMAQDTGVAEVAQPEISGPEIPELEGADSPAVLGAPAGETAADSRIFEIPKLTEIEVEILEPLGSKLSTSLDTFSIRLAAPIMVDGVEVVPAGTMGAGEVVHAKKAGGMGAAGELVLAARYLDLGDRRVRLRSMQLTGEEATSRIGTANAIGTAGAATVLPIAFIGFLVKGGQIDVPAGSIATAKIAEDFTIMIAADAGVPSDMAENAEMAEAVPSPDEQIPAEQPAVISEEAET